MASSKGQIQPIFLITAGIVLLGVVATVLFFLNGLTGDINTQLASDPSMNQVAKDIINDADSRFPKAFDNGIGILVGGLAIAAFLAGATIRRNAIALIIFFILLIIFGYFGMVFNNAWLEVADDLGDYNITTDFPITYSIYSNIAFVLMGLIFIVGLGMIFGERLDL